MSDIVTSRTSIRLGAGAAVVLIATLLGVLLWPSVDSAGPCVVVSRASLPEIPEASGLAVSRRTPGLLWSHNDSGNAAVLFALDTAGAVRGRVRLPNDTRDWEDVSSARCGNDNCVFIADIGDNWLSRGRVQVYRVPEPLPTDTVTAKPEIFNLTYPDGPHNAEAMFIVDTDLFIITRDRVGSIFRAPMRSDTNRDITLERLGQLGVKTVTDAESSVDGKSVAVRTPRQVLLYRTTDVIAGRYAPYFRIPLAGLKEPQGEGVALDGNMLYLASEGKPWHRAGSFIALRCVLR